MSDTKYKAATTITMSIKASFLFLFALVVTTPLLAQFTYQKDTIYLKFEPNEGNSPYYRGIKFYNKEENGVVFNLLTKRSLLYKDKSQSADTLSIEKLKNYCIITTEEVEQKVKAFQKATYKKWPSHKDDKNDLFVTYLIEIINGKQFVIYPVIWRNEGATP